ncbi:TetR family transcriptional regulator C-terminal domain-containing protein [Sphingomonas bacterium]|uniref:TetR family transcriptional regulator C-terminal domain-containing protein n=1 Tax=Sphingomonas bacterium TaxID=1895847 RepID=UPI001575DB6B|nr:TetR family transcriptional regulator C-terminal domain-containing protein [Sphingomonas bacterium]
MTTARRTRIQIRNETAILENAQRVFATHGFRGATMEAIAALAGMSQPNLHNYFRTKAELYQAVLERTLDIWLEPIGGLDPDGEPGDELRLYVNRKLEMSRQFPEASRVFAQDMLEGASVLSPHLSGRVREKALAFAAIVNGWIAAGKFRPVNPLHLLFFLWGATQHYADFAPQVRAVLDIPKLGRLQFTEAEETFATILFGGLLMPKPNQAVLDDSVIK